MASDNENASDMLVQFLTDFSGLMNCHLKSIQTTITGTVDELMDGIQKLNEAAEKGRSEAEQKLENTYLNPNAETQILVNDLQKNVADLFDAVKEKHTAGESLEDAHAKEPSVIVLNRLKRLNSVFSDSSEQLETVSEDIKNVLFGLIGALSSEDVIAQRISHVINSLKSLEASLSYILIDFETRCGDDVVIRTIEDVKRYTLEQYTSEIEKEEFRKFFKTS